MEMITVLSVGLSKILKEAIYAKNLAWCLVSDKGSIKMAIIMIVIGLPEPTGGTVYNMYSSLIQAAYTSHFLAPGSHL